MRNSFFVCLVGCLGGVLLKGSLFAQDLQNFHVKSTLEASRNRQALSDPSQNAYFFLKVIPQYTLENKWSVGINQGARQRIKPVRVWNWADSAFFTLSPTYRLSESVSFRSILSLLYPTSDFSRRDLQMRWGLGATNYFTWKLSGGREWSFQSLEYVLKLNKKFYAFKTDVAGQSVTEWLFFHALELNCMTFEKLGWSVALSADSELKSSGRIQNSYALTTTFSYEILSQSAVYLTLSNSGFSDGTQERFGRLGKFYSRDTEITLGTLISY
jgi:hypothetical protein